MVGRVFALAQGMMFGFLYKYRVSLLLHVVLSPAARIHSNMFSTVLFDLQQP